MTENRTTIWIGKDTKLRMDKHMVKGSYEFNLKLWLDKIEAEKKKEKKK